MRYGFQGTPRPAGGFELFSWFFMRISGALLIVLVLGHLAVMHLIAGVHNIDYDFVVQRYKNPIWRTWDFAMLLLALLHGTNGLRIVIEDYVQSKKWRLAAVTALGAVLFVVIIMGLLPILTFVPVGAGGMEVVQHGP
jgi:succinate dehydrogenase / fumarate reductase membrane anchor subunit